MTSDKFEWTSLDKRAVNTIRVLAADAVEKTGNGHPGTAMSLAPVAYLIFQRYLRHLPTVFSLGTSVSLARKTNTSALTRPSKPTRLGLPRNSWAMKW